MQNNYIQLQRTMQANYKTLATLHTNHQILFNYNIFRKTAECRKKPEFQDGKSLIGIKTHLNTDEKSLKGIKTHSKTNIIILKKINS